jgi:hypothetical protein
MGRKNDSRPDLVVDVRRGRKQAIKRLHPEEISVVILIEGDD